MRLAEEGAALRIFDPAPADEAVADIRAAGGQADAVLGDVTDAESIRAAFARPGWSPDLLVNVAGVFAWEDVLDPGRDDWERTLAVDLGGVMRCVRAAPAGGARRGRGGRRRVPAV